MFADVSVRVASRASALCFCILALSAPAEDVLWEWVTPTPQGHDLFAAATGNGVTVAVGRGGAVVTSADGVRWRTTNTGSGYALWDVAWGNGVFVAVGGELGFEFSPGLGVILTSADGFNWVESHREDFLTLEAVEWTGSRFVAVGVGSRVLLSDGGMAWSEVHLEGSEFIWDLAWNGTLLVAIGGYGYFGGPAFVFTSETGEVWSQSEIGRDDVPSSIAAAGGRFVAVGSERDALVSDDGLTWTAAPYEAQSKLRHVVGDGGRFLATGYGVVGTSLDGFVWSIEDLSTSSSVNGLAWDGADYLGVGDDGFMMSSAEGSRWTQLSENAFEYSGTWEIDELAIGGSTIVGVGAGIVRSRRGVDWEWHPAPGDVGLVSVIWTGSEFWAVGEFGIINGVDGLSWNQALLDYDIRLNDIVWNGSLFVAVGWNPSSGDGRKLVLTSPDGTDWSYQWFDQEEHLLTVGWTGSRFVASGTGAYDLTSADGTDWVRLPKAEDLKVADMAWNGTRLVAVGGNWGDEEGGVIRSTEDGVHWVECTLPEGVSDFDDVTWTGTHFAAVSRSSGDRVFTSADGWTWSVESTGTGVGPVSVVGDARNLFVTGRGLKIIRRTQSLDGPGLRRSGRRLSPGGETARVVAERTAR
jgi:hypothetical protein